MTISAAAGSRRALPAAAAVAGRLRAPAAAASAASWYADPVNGNDSNAGTEGQPFRTVHRALAASRSGPSPARIVLRAGTFYLAQEGGPIMLTAQDSGLSIEAYPGEVPVLSGAVPITGLTWSMYSSNASNGMQGPFTDTTDVDSCINAPGESSNLCSYNGTTPDWQTCEQNCAANSTCTAYTWHDAKQGVYALDCYFRIDGVWTGESQSGHISGYKANPATIWQASLAGVQGLKMPFDTILFADTNRRAVRARFPNGNPELSQTPVGFTDAASWLAPKSYPNPTDITIPTPNRPADVWFPTFQWGLDGTVSNFNPPGSFWGSTNPPAGSQYQVPSGLVWGKGFSPRAANWSNPSTGIVHAFHGGRWGDWAFSVAAVDGPSSTIHFGTGGWQEARGWNAGSEFYVENIFEELDAAGEWFLDSSSGTLYMAFNSTPTAATALLATQLENLLTITGTQDEPAVGVSVTNITLAQTSTTFMRPYEVPSGGDWSFYRGGMLFAEGTEELRVSGCTLWSPGGNGLVLSRYNRNATIAYNEFAYCGESAIVSAGVTDLIDGTNGDQPADALIAYNVMREVGLYTKQSGAYYAATSRSVHLLGNVAFNLPRAGFNINDGFAGGHVLEQNLVFNAVRETADHGCFNSWDRQPYAYDASNASIVLPQPSYLRSNFFINNYHSTWPIDHDDGSNAYVASGNLLLWGGFKNYLGFNKAAVGNLYVYPDASVSMHKMRGGKEYGRVRSGSGSGGWPYCAMSQGSASTPQWMWDTWVNNTCIMSSGAGNMYDWGTCNVAHPYDGNIPLLGGNTVMSGDGSYGFKCGGTTWNTLAEAQSHGVDIGSTFVPSVPSTAQILSMAAQWIKLQE